jgi:hypothetical protein
MPWRPKGSGSIAPPFLASAIDVGELSASRSCRFTPRGKVPGTHWLGGWVRPMADLNTGEENNFALSGIKPGSPRMEDRKESILNCSCIRKVVTVTSRLLCLSCLWAFVPEASGPHSRSWHVAERRIRSPTWNLSPAAQPPSLLSSPWRLPRRPYNYEEDMRTSPRAKAVLLRSGLQHVSVLFHSFLPVVFFALEWMQGGIIESPLSWMY